MLKRIFIIVHVIIIIIRVGKEVIFYCEGISCRYIYFWQMKIFRFSDCKNILFFIAKVSALLVSQVGIGISVANNFEWSFYPDRSVVGGDHHLYAFICKFFK